MSVVPRDHRFAGLRYPTGPDTWMTVTHLETGAPPKFRGCIQASSLATFPEQFLLLLLRVIAVAIATIVVGVPAV